MAEDYISIPIFGQLASCIETLKNTIEFANDAIWAHGEPPFWQFVLHSISSLDLYFSTFDKDISDPLEKYSLPAPLAHYEKFTHFDNTSEELANIEPAPKKDLNDYLQYTREKIKKLEEQGIIDQLSETSGFPWLPFTKFELILHVIRHMSGHNGSLNQLV